MINDLDTSVSHTSLSGVNGVWSLAQMVKNLPAIQETWVRSLGREDPLEKGMAHSSILAWRIPWQKGLVSYSPWGCKESDMTERLTISCHLLLYKHLPLRPVNPGLFLSTWWPSTRSNKRKFHREEHLPLDPDTIPCCVNWKSGSDASGLTVLIGSIFTLNYSAQQGGKNAPTVFVKLSFNSTFLNFCIWDILGRIKTNISQGR